MSRVAFLDEAVIEVSGGLGGNGVASFLRTRRDPHGGPDGGNGGNGGSVYAKAVPGIGSLVDYVYTPRKIAGRGTHGSGKQKHGARGQDLWLSMPLGTDIFDDATGYLHASLVVSGDEVELARGGEGGRGNMSFKSSTNRAPRQATSGQLGDVREFRLTLRLLANVGLVGRPNAGKSTLLNAVANTTSAIGAYPFTTLRPQLGVVEMDDFSQLTIADIPGLIENAANGAGLGTRFLRHITRTTLLLHLVDASDADMDAIAARHDEVMHELEQAQAGLLDKPCIVVLTKMDLLAPAQVKDLLRHARTRFANQVLAISALAGTGLVKLLAQSAEQARACAVNTD